MPIHIVWRFLNVLYLIAYNFALVGVLDQKPTKEHPIFLLPNGIQAITAYISLKITQIYSRVTINTFYKTKNSLD
tara:strand:- start:5080 stop:5304 length:225 start_codon:yes stop_codon:yes gene_type:complete